MGMIRGCNVTVKEIYYYLKDRCECLRNGLFEEVILALVGSYGLAVLRDAGLLEITGAVDGRRLYALRELKDE